MPANDFGIDGTSGAVTVDGSLDYETATSHDITVLAKSTDGSTSSKSFTISVTDDASDNDVATFGHSAIKNHFWGDVGIDDWVYNDPSLLVYKGYGGGVSWLSLRITLRNMVTHIGRSLAIGITSLACWISLSGTLLSLRGSLTRNSKFSYEMILASQMTSPFI